MDNKFDEEFENQYQSAVKNAKEREFTEPLGISVKYYPKRRNVIIKLNNNATFTFPVDNLQGLKGASDDKLKNVSLTHSGTDICWEELDVYFSITSLLIGMFGNKKWMSELGRIGGSSKSAVKSEAARQNGKKGGRPKKEVTDTYAKSV